MPALDEDTARLVDTFAVASAGRPSVRRFRGLDAPGGPLAGLETGVYRIAAIDPGDSWGGLSEIDLKPGGGILLGGGFVDQSRYGKIRLMTCRTLRPLDLCDELDRMAPLLAAVVLERYSLYPWMAREQGFSEMLTPQMIGMVRWIARSHGVPVYLQDSKGTLKEGADADVTIIDPNREWTIDAEQFASKSRNCPFHGWEVTGRATTTIVGGQVKWSLAKAATK